MAAGSFVLLTQAALGLGQAKFNLGSDTLVCVLLDASYTPNENTDATWANQSTHEVASGGGYTQGGVVLGGQAWAVSGGTTSLSAESPQWTSSTITAKYAAVVRRAGVSLASTDLLLGYVDLNTASGSSTVSSTSGTFQVNWNGSSTPSVAAALFNLTHTP